MTKIVTRLLAATAALGLVSAPIVAQANTRAANSPASYSTTNALPGLGRASEGEGQEEGGVGPLLLGVAAVALVIAGVTIAADDDDCASPGAC